MCEVCWRAHSRQFPQKVRGPLQMCQLLSGVWNCQVSKHSKNVKTLAQKQRNPTFLLQEMLTMHFPLWKLRQALSLNPPSTHTISTANSKQFTSPPPRIWCCFGRLFLKINTRHSMENKLFYKHLRFEKCLSQLHTSPTEVDRCFMIYLHLPGIKIFG